MSLAPNQPVSLTAQALLGWGEEGGACHNKPKCGKGSSGGSRRRERVKSGAKMALTVTVTVTKNTVTVSNK